MELKIFEGFAGYGGGSFALKRIKKLYPNFEYNVIGYSENDKYASEVFDLNHKDKNNNLIKNYDFAARTPHFFRCEMKAALTKIFFKNFSIFVQKITLVTI